MSLSTQLLMLSPLFAYLLLSFLIYMRETAVARYLDDRGRPGGVRLTGSVTGLLLMVPNAVFIVTGEPVNQLISLLSTLFVAALIGKAVVVDGHGFGHRRVVWIAEWPGWSASRGPAREVHTGDAQFDAAVRPQGDALKVLRALRPTVRSLMVQAMADGLRITEKGIWVETESMLASRASVLRTAALAADLADAFDLEQTMAERIHEETHPAVRERLATLALTRPGGVELAREFLGEGVPEECVADDDPVRRLSAVRLLGAEGAVTSLSLVQGDDAVSMLARAELQQRHGDVAQGRLSAAHAHGLLTTTGS